MSYTGDYTATDRTLISVRGGYMKDNYFDTGVNKSQTFEYATATASLPPTLLATVPAQYRPAGGLQQSPAHSDQGSRHHDSQLRRLLADADSQCRRPAPVQGRLRLSRVPTNDVELAYPNNGYVTRLLELRRSRATCLAWAPAGAHTATTRSTTSARIGKTGANILQPLRPGQLDSRVAADTEPRPSHGKRGHPVLPSRHPGGRHSLRLGREAGSAPRLRLQPVRRRPGEDLRIVRPLLRLDEVRAGARHVRWRHLDDALSLARRSGYLRS